MTKNQIAAEIKTVEAKLASLRTKLNPVLPKFKLRNVTASCMHITTLGNARKNNFIQAGATEPFTGVGAPERQIIIYSDEDGVVTGYDYLDGALGVVSLKDLTTT